jgi:hypothetical protein
MGKDTRGWTLKRIIYKTTKCFIPLFSGLGSEHGVMKLTKEEINEDG